MDSLAELIPPVMDKKYNFAYKRGFVPLITSIAAGFLVLTTMTAGAPTSAEAPEADTVYLELANHYGVDVPKKGFSVKEKDILINASKIENYYRSQKTKMPMADYAYQFAYVAAKYDLNPALMPAIARFETSGGRNLCQSEEGSFNPFGFGSCRMAFDSFEHAFDHVAYSLSGENPNTKIYAGKTIKEKLLIYNPPSVKGILPGYHKHILKAIEEINSQEVLINGEVVG